MKRLFPFLLLLCSTAFAAEYDQKWIDLFREAKYHLSHHQIAQATPYLEQLYKLDNQNPNINYLLALCYIRQDTFNDQSVEMLRLASGHYSGNYDPASFKETHVPQYVYYYQVLAYGRQKECEQALKSMNRFYAVYAYQDDSYLIDAQKWVRECFFGKKEEEPRDTIEAIASKSPAEIATEEPELAQIATRPNVDLKVEQEEKPIESNPAVSEATGQPTSGSDPTKLDPTDYIGTKQISYTTYNALYAIQIGSFTDPVYARAFPDLKNIEVFVDDQGVFRYVIGRFLYKSQADALLEKINSKGYPDAYIVNINDIDRYSAEVATVGGRSIHEKIRGRVDFRVQIGAFEDIVPERIVEYYMIVDDITPMSQNNLTILTVGSYGTYADASLERDRLVDNGLSDAFITAFNQDRKIPLDEAQNYLETKKGSRAFKSGEKFGKYTVSTSEKAKRKKRRLKNLGLEVNRD